MAYKTKPHEPDKEPHVIVCDFCNGTPPHTLFAATHLTTGQRQRCWRWAGCKSCTADIQAGNWEPVRERAIEAVRRMWKASHATVPPRSVYETAVAMSFQLFHQFAIKES